MKKILWKRVIAAILFINGFTIGFTILHCTIDETTEREYTILDNYILCTTIVSGMLCAAIVCAGVFYIAKKLWTDGQ